MGNPAARGAVLVAFAVLLGFLILNFGADLNPTIGEASASPDSATTVEVNTTGTTAPAAADTANTGAVAVAAPTPLPDLSSARPNGQVVVLVANGTAVPNQASRLTDRLRNQGFNTRNPKTATTQDVSTIYYRPGFEVEAGVVKSVLGTDTAIAPMPVPDPPVGDTIDLVPVNVLVLIGADDLSAS